MEWKKHCYRVGTHSDSQDDLPTEPDKLDGFILISRKRIEPWLSAVFQAEHLNLMLGSGFTTSIGRIACVEAVDMAKVTFGTSHDAAINAHADAGAKVMNRGPANIEDQFRSAFALLEGLAVIDTTNAAKLKTAMNTQMSAFLASLLKAESGISRGKDHLSRGKAEAALQSLLIEFRKPRRVSGAAACLQH